MGTVRGEKAKRNQMVMNFCLGVDFLDTHILVAIGSDIFGTTWSNFTLFHGLALSQQHYRVLIISHNTVNISYRKFSQTSPQ